MFAPTPGNAASTTLAPTLPRRVTYVVPPPTSPPPLLNLPPLNFDRRGRTAPIYTTRKAPTGYKHSKYSRDQASSHPRHRLAVQALALDLSTSLASTNARNAEPGGILYTGARDGLLCSWELNLPTRRRKKQYGRPTIDGDEEEDDEDGAGTTSSDEDEQDRLDASADGIDLDDLENNVTSASSHGINSQNGIGARGRSGSNSIRRDSTASHATTRGPRVDTNLHLQGEPLPFETRWEIDDVRIRKNGGAPDATFRQCIQSHTDWVNDVVLCNNNQTLVSASSDSLVLAWSPHASDHHDQVTPKTIGRHDDYVRCLTTAREPKWVASGGFDRKIKLWDLGEGRTEPIVEIAAPASIYSLSSIATGSMIAAGTPERNIRVWDPRSRSQVARLGGHTDNVRGVLLGEEGKWLLSASSDSTVKLWSLAAQKCLHTFSHHSESVWSIFSQHPSLEIFYTGDRVGNLCKIDLQGTGDPGEGECILLARDGADEVGEARNAGCRGITQIVANDDTYVWTAGTSSSVRRWQDVPRRITRAGAVSARRNYDREGMASVISLSTSLDTHEPLLPAARPQTPPAPPFNLPEDRERTGQPSVSFLEGLTTGLSRTTSSPTPNSLLTGDRVGINRPSSLRARPISAATTAQRPSFAASTSSTQYPNSTITNSKTLFDIPYDSLVPLTSPEDSYFSPAFLNRARDPDAATIYSSTSVTSVPTYGLTSRIATSTSPLSYQNRPRSISEAAHETNIARREYTVRESCDEAIPLRTKPDSVIRGGHGLMRCELLNDRRHVLTVDTEDEIALWDIVRGECIGVVDSQEVAQFCRRPSDVGSTVSGTGSALSESVTASDALELVRERIEGEAAITSWCKCDARVGSLVVHLEEARVFDGEVYADESLPSQEHNFGPDHRLSLGKWVLRNLFDSFIEAELELRAGGGTPIPRSKLQSRAPNFISLSGLVSPISTTAPPLKTPGMTIALATPALNKVNLPNEVMSPPLSSSANLRRPRDLDPIPQSPTPHIFDASAFARSATPLGTKTPTTTTGRAEGDYFSLPTASAEAAAVPPNGAPLPTPVAAPGGSLMGRLRNFGKTSRKSTVDSLETPNQPPTAVSAPTELAETRSVAEQQQHRILQTVFSQPLEPCTAEEAPPIVLNPNMAVIISEETSDSSAWSVTYRGLVATGREDLGVLEQKAPLWLLEFLLGNRTIIKEPTKLSFLIQPWLDENGVSSLPELPNSNARLTANRTLRLRKVMGYVADKLNIGVGSSRAASISSGAEGTAATSISSDQLSFLSSFDVEKDLEILVASVILPKQVTIATARAYHWKQGGDMILHYRIKHKTSVVENS